MLFKLHYFCLTAGANSLGILLGVYMANYTDATPAEIGLLYMIMPFIGLIFRPILCSMADRRQAHREYLIVCELMTALSFAPFVIIPYLGEEFHESHPRFCWYSLVSFRIVGDIAFKGAISIGDSLAINYAARLGTEFSTYRIWGTIAWMIFGMITGHLNEIWFLPKYVAGFMVLILASLVDALAFYLWPREYFVMVTTSTMKKEKEQHQLDQEKSEKPGKRVVTRSLMPREKVWAHAKKQLWSLITCSCLLASSNEQTRPKTASDSSIGISPIPGHNLDDKTRPRTNFKPTLDNGSINKRAQFQVLFLLMRRDPRIIGYLLVFVGAGAALIPLSFFFISLSNICHTQHTCDFSKLGGYLQLSMALFETILFLHIKAIVLKIGRLNSLSIAFGLAAIKHLFYGTIWPHVNPHWSLVSESVSGISFGIFLTLMVEMGHYFATEVEHLIPELVQRGVIRGDDKTSRENLKLSLAATMQALISSATDGIGRGMGALIYGLIIDAYSYQTLWLVIGATMTCSMIALQLANLLENCCNVKVGFQQAEDSNSRGHSKKFKDLENLQISLGGSSSKLTTPATMENGPHLMACKETKGLANSHLDDHLDAPSGQPARRGR